MASTLYDNHDIAKELECGRSASPVSSSIEEDKKGKTIIPGQETPAHALRPNDVPQQNLNEWEVSAYEQIAAKGMELLNDIVLKQYLSKLSSMNTLPLDERQKGGIILFKINKMVYEKDEYATDKFISVASAMTYAHCAICLIIDGKKEGTDFYLGVRCNDAEKTDSSIASTLNNVLKGQFPGIGISDDFVKVGQGMTHSKQDTLLKRFTATGSISSYVGVPSYKNTKGEYTNVNFIQGIEKFATAMQGEEYTAIVLADNIQRSEIENIRIAYENIYTQISTMATQQLSYSTSESLANAITRTNGYTDTTGNSLSKGWSVTETTGVTTTEGTSHSTTRGTTQENATGKIAKGISSFSTALRTISMPLISIGTALSVTGAGVAVGGPLLALGAFGMGASTLTGVAGSAVAMGAKTKQQSVSESQNKSEAFSQNTAKATSENETSSNSHAEQFSQTDGQTATISGTKNFSLTLQNKHLLEALKRIDKQLSRIEQCESTGLWSASTYFLSYDNDRATAETAATIFRSIMQGETSGVETTAINTWYKNRKDSPDFTNIRDSVIHLTHPLFVYNHLQENDNMTLTPTSLISSKELAILIGLPRKSVPGLPVLEHVSLAKEVVLLDEGKKGDMRLGRIFDQGKTYDTEVNLLANSLTQHTLVTGSTGSGKSNTVYFLLKQMRNLPSQPKFLVIEPAKGEYKEILGTANVLGTTPGKIKLLQINPFRFPDGIHVLEHVDRIVEIFNVCWPMYAAMPAVLKEGILESYKSCGWNMVKSINHISKNLFPTFMDLEIQLKEVIHNSGFSEEVKSNYQGALLTRVRSLSNGINGEIFCGGESGDKLLFDEDTIVDLSRVGAQETKALIMGILIMRMNEYRSVCEIEPNSPLRHITILEEAHNLLKRGSHEMNSEGSNLAGKSVEMIATAIAEMRTYGEGFIIVDQSPGALDISAISNTNTKIIMRLPEENDRRIAGKSAALKDSQIDEIAKLPTGVAVVYQHNWESAVLCKIDRYSDKAESYKDKFQSITDDHMAGMAGVIDFLLSGRIIKEPLINTELVFEAIGNLSIATQSKVILYSALDEYKTISNTSFWHDKNFKSLSQIVTDMLNLRDEVALIAKTVKSFEYLNESITNLVQKRLPDLSSSLSLTVNQCLMRDYAIDNPTRTQVYSCWLQTIKQLNNGKS